MSAHQSCYFNIQFAGGDFPDLYVSNIPLPDSNLLLSFIFTAGRAMGAVHRSSLCMKHFRHSVCLVAVVEWSDVALWPEVCPDVMVYAAIRDTDFLFDFVCAEIFSEVGEDGVWRV